MRFDLRLDVPAAVPPEERSDVTYDTELDDVRSILRDLCGSLAELPDVRFIVTVGDPMPVSVRRDLVVVMEQLRDVLAGLREEGTATLDLYEQGIEAQLLFAVRDGQIRIERRDLLGRPVPPREMDLPREMIMDCLRTLARTFVDVARRRSPERSAHPWFTDWAQSLLTTASQ
ncbi:hypothetical protein JQX13_53560 [Archangium violaceum]|uniref:hypothetical protein n=1 Tax=Archangium violaceum TaxID=83451 RepID=UPI00193B6EB1|nr:hypothetical protein [Archangium violaceum]QRK08616.1 hypothetical protein JQX13_53560 [Archangium violaceum]